MVEEVHGTTESFLGLLAKIGILTNPGAATHQHGRNDPQNTRWQKSLPIHPKLAFYTSNR
jgi:hypothetical protein